MFYFCIFGSLLLWLLYKFLTRKNKYFEKWGIPYEVPELGFGNIRKAILFQDCICNVEKNLYDKFRDYRYCGYFHTTSPELLIIDHELVNRILIQDFSYFNENGRSFNKDHEKYSTATLFAAKTDEWKMLRNSLSPGFSSTRIKYMFEHMLAASERFLKYIPEILDEAYVDAKLFCSKYAVDAMTGAALSLNLSDSAGSTEFNKMGQQILGSTGFKDDFRTMIINFLPRLGTFLGLSFLGPETGDFFKSLLKQQVRIRGEKNLKLNDFLEFLGDVQQKTTEYEFTDYHLVSTVLIFLTDGFEVSSSAMAYTLYELAINPKIMKQLQTKIDQVYEKSSNPISYESVREFKFLQSCIMEALRLHSPVLSLRKRCLKPYKLPPAKDGGPEFEVPVGMRMNIPLKAIMMNPEYYPEPERFNPDRWDDENIRSILPGTNLQFGSGPRICLGKRAAMIEMQLGLATLLRNYDVELHPKTMTPIREDPRATFFSRPLGGIWIKIKKRL